MKAIGFIFINPRTTDHGESLLRISSSVHPGSVVQGVELLEYNLLNISNSFFFYFPGECPGIPVRSRDRRVPDDGKP